MISSNELKMNELRDLCRSWGKEIDKDFHPDLIVFIAKSGFVIADEFAKEMRVPIDEIYAQRRGGKIKKIVTPVFRVLPLNVRNRIVSMPIMYRMNDKKSERDVIIPDSLYRKAESGKYSNILLIDDSIDTGWTFKLCFEKIKEIFLESNIKTLALIKMHYAKKRFEVDYYLYNDTLLLTPAQMDSDEHDIFLKEYNEWRRSK